MDTAPQYDGDAFSTAWLGSVLGSPVKAAHHQLLTADGGMMCSLQRITAEMEDGTTKTFIFKQLVGEGKLATSRSLGLVREASFYNSQLSKEFGSLIAKSYYAFKVDETGEKYILLEDLQPAIQAGFMFGPGNPNNWAKLDQLATISRNFLGDRKLFDYIDESFKGLGRIHAKFWNDKELLALKWLRGHEWFSQQDEDGWKSVQKIISEKWNTTKSSLDANFKQPNGCQWNKQFVELVDASVQQISWDTYLSFTKTTNWTLVTGDCHPANFMWIPEVEVKHSVKVVDFEMVGVGNGPQELAQFLISHMEPALRRSMEHDLLTSYHRTLLQHGVSNYDFAACYKDYVEGGVCRWVWMVVWMSDLLPKEMEEYFNAQTYAFCVDHNVTAATIRQPRP